MFTKQLGGDSRNAAMCWRRACQGHRYFYCKDNNSLRERVQLRFVTTGKVRADLFVDNSQNSVDTVIDFEIIHFTRFWTASIIWLERISVEHWYYLL